MKSNTIGASFSYSEHRFRSRIVVNKIEITLGYFGSINEAMLAYDKYVISNNLNRRINFPNPEPENLIPNTRLIRLTQGKFAVVDEEDFEELNQYNWIASRYGKSYYASRSGYINGDKKIIKMHRQIMNYPDSMIDHANGDGLHNYKSNLRLCTLAQNNRNQRPQKNTKSIYKGVHPSENGQFRAQIRFNRKGIHLGIYGDETEAAKAYDAKAKELFGEFARLNFPNLKD